MAELLYEASKVFNAINPASRNAGTNLGNELNLIGYDRVLYILHVGTVTATGTLDVKIRDTTAAGGTYADVTSAVFAQVTDTGGSQVYTVDCPVVSNRHFQKISCTGATAAAVFGVIAIPYNGNRVKPVSQAATAVVA